MPNDPQVIDARYRKGNELRTAGNDAAAEVELRAVLDADPLHRDATYSLAFMLREQGRTEAASTVVAAWWRHAQPDANETLSAIGFIVECSAHARAAEIATSAALQWPADARIAARAGEIALALGRFDEAHRFLRTAVDLDANQSASWLRLSYCQRYRDASDGDIGRFATTAADTNFTQATRICAGFALGKALDDVGNIEGAVAALRDANSGARAASRWNAAAWSAFVERRLREEIPAARSPSAFAPIFIIGMPRTGTTLVSTLLARNSDVRDRGELNWIPAIFEQVSGIGRLKDPDALRTCAQLVEIHMRRDDAPARYYIDKNPLNFGYVDFILSMLPNARFVYCKRDARDTALSIWMQHFAHENLGFAYDFSDIGLVEKDQRRLMERWSERWSNRILAFDYEALVAAPEEQARRLADFLSLDSNRSAGTSEASQEQTLTTASVWQARQPVYTTSVNRWKTYAPYLPELLAAFPE